MGPPFFRAFCVQRNVKQSSKSVKAYQAALDKLQRLIALVEIRTSVALSYVLESCAGNPCWNMAHCRDLFEPNDSRRKSKSEEHIGKVSTSHAPGDVAM